MIHNEMFRNIAKTLKNMLKEKLMNITKSI